MVISLLLSLEPKVQVIRALHPPNPTRDKYRLLLPVYLEPIRGMMAAGSTLPQWTNTLSTLAITLRSFSWWCIAPLFRLPVLKTLILNDREDLGGTAQVGVIHPDDKEVEVLVCSSSIEVLDFGRCAPCLTTIAKAVSVCKALRVLRHIGRPIPAATQNLQLLQGLHHASTLHALKTCGWTAAEWQSIDDGVLADFTALTELEIRYSDVADHLLPPNLRRLIVCATAAALPSIVEEMKKPAEKLSKRRNLDITLKYLHYREKDQKYHPRLHQLPAVFTELGLNLSLYVHPFIGSTCKSPTPSDVALVQANGKERVYNRTM